MVIPSIAIKSHNDANDNADNKARRARHPPGGHYRVPNSHSMKTKPNALRRSPSVSGASGVAFGPAGAAPRPETRPQETRRQPRRSGGE